MKFAYGALLFVQGALADKFIKMASISDIHLFPMYDPNYSNDNYCWPNSGSNKMDPPATFGQYLCDPPVDMVEVMF